MLERPEKRARLRRRLEQWPGGRGSPLSINEGLELLDLVDRLQADLRRLTSAEHFANQFLALAKAHGYRGAVAKLNGTA